VNKAIEKIKGKILYIFVFLCEIFLFVDESESFFYLFNIISEKQVCVATCECTRRATSTTALMC